MTDESKTTGDSLARSLRQRMSMAQRHRQAKRGEPISAVEAEVIPLNEPDLVEDHQSHESNLAESIDEIVEDELAEEETVQYCAFCAAAADELQADTGETEPEFASTIAEHTCLGCKMPLCETHAYREENGTLTFCYTCADEKVGICADCGVLHARPCRECAKKVCDDCAKKVIERWGWGGSPGQGGVTSWFPFTRTYCQEHGQGRIDAIMPSQKNFVGYDGSSPEW